MPSATTGGQQGLICMYPHGIWKINALGNNRWSKRTSLPYSWLCPIWPAAPKTSLITCTHTGIEKLMPSANKQVVKKDLFAIFMALSYLTSCSKNITYHLYPHGKKIDALGKKTGGQQGLIYMYPHGKWNDAKSDAIIIAKDMLKTSNGQREDGRLYPHGK